MMDEKRSGKLSGFGLGDGETLLQNFWMEIFEIFHNNSPLKLGNFPALVIE